MVYYLGRGKLLPPFLAHIASLCAQDNLPKYSALKSKSREAYLDQVNLLAD
jgi:hypothetical protein